MSQFAAHFLLMSSPRKAQNSLAYLDKLSNQPTMTNSLPTREDSIKTLRKNEEFDVLIIGGGSTGAGAALDAASRGFKTICVEREDFSSGTSSRSTKLIWGGSRYLVQALMSLFSFSLIKDPHKTIKKFNGDMKMVMNCHKERKFLLQNQHHLVYWLPIAVPLKQWILWPPPFGYYPAALGPLGLFPVFFKFVRFYFSLYVSLCFSSVLFLIQYDSLGGFTSPPSHIMFPARAKRKFPQLNNAEIKYCSIFYEGMHDDARTNLAIALTAATKGACMANYCEVTDLLYELPNKKGKVVGAVICDTLTGEKFEIRAKGVMFCGGPFTDELRRLEHNFDEPFTPAVLGSSGNMFICYYIHVLYDIV
jgi:glycerol-3-phosphate dehydrogenase